MKRSVSSGGQSACSGPFSRQLRQTDHMNWLGHVSLCCIAGSFRARAGLCKQPCTQTQRPNRLCGAPPCFRPVSPARLVDPHSQGVLSCFLPVDAAGRPCEAPSKFCPKGHGSAHAMRPLAHPRRAVELAAARGRWRSGGAQPVVQGVHPAATGCPASRQAAPALLSRLRRREPRVAPRASCSLHWPPPRP